MHVERRWWTDRGLHKSLRPIVIWVSRSPQLNLPSVIDLERYGRYISRHGQTTAPCFIVLLGVTVNCSSASSNQFCRVQEPYQATGMVRWTHIGTR